MARYRVTLDVDAVDKDDANHWAFFIAGLETVMRGVDVVSVIRLGPSLAPEVQERNEQKPSGRDRHSEDYRFWPRHGSA